MKTVYVAADNIVSALGATTETNFAAVLSGRSGIAYVDDPGLSDKPAYLSLVADIPDFAGSDSYTRFERLCIASVTGALAHGPVSLASADTVFILSTTKGNIDLLAKSRSEETIARTALHNTAQLIASHFNSPNMPLVVSSACISGILGVVVAGRLLQSGQYKHAVVTGADVISRFVVSGFQALHATSDAVCRPFDKSRNGINLGEAAATMVLTTDGELLTGDKIVVNGGAITNDANHLTGPSRTGEELFTAISNTLSESGKSADELSFVSAHGTATLFNDAMETKAINLAGLQQVPVHSLKAYYGHTLGAAGVVESILSIHSLKKGVVLASKNFEQAAEDENLNVNRTVAKSLKTSALKTASGFGGFNAAVMYSLIQ